MGGFREVTIRRWRFAPFVDTLSPVIITFNNFSPKCKFRQLYGTCFFNPYQYMVGIHNFTACPGPVFVGTIIFPGTVIAFYVTQRGYRNMYSAKCKMSLFTETRMPGYLLLEFSFGISPVPFLANIYLFYHSHRLAIAGPDFPFYRYA